MTGSKSLKKLALEGFIKRSEHEKDTRAKSVRLTAKGKVLISKLVPIVEKIDEKFFGAAGATNQQSLVHILGKIIANHGSQ